jgi:hypothetical protein
MFNGVALIRLITKTAILSLLILSGPIGMADDNITKNYIFHKKHLCTAIPVTGAPGIPEYGIPPEVLYKVDPRCPDLKDGLPKFFIVGGEQKKIK